MKRRVLCRRFLAQSLVLALAAMLVGSPVAWSGSTDLFVDSGQNLGTSDSMAVALGDVDGDGDLDAFVANQRLQADEVWLNDGSGTFTDSGQRLGSTWSYAVALGDVDGDGDLDAFVVDYWFGHHKVWLNNGAGTFSDSGQNLASSGYNNQVVLGDVDGDGDLDACVSAWDHRNMVWVNDGTGTFMDGGQNLGTESSIDVALGDVDGDGDVDVFVANADGQPDKVWLNDGTGTFADSGQNLSSTMSNSVALGDLDGDGDLDAFVATGNAQGHRVWLNDGTGMFGDSGQVLGNSWARRTALGDLDNDGDLDAFVANHGDPGAPDEVWLNDGAGSFTDSGLRLGSFYSGGLALGDVDGDGDLDAFVAHAHGQPNKVWLSTANDNQPPTANAGGPYSGGEGSAIALDTAGASDPDGDDLIYAWTVSDDVLCSFDDPTILHPNLTCADNGAFQVTLEVSDGQESASSDAVVTVDNVVPAVESIAVPWQVPVNIHEQGVYSVDATFSDPAGTNDELFTCAFDFDNDGADDTTVDGVSGTACSAPLADEARPGYADPGVYTVRVTVTDKDGGAGSATAAEYIVIYDPLGGFVTGGGWIWSEAGWCQLDEVCAGAEGKANFGFVSKYQKGASIPSGQTEFQFKAGGLDFHSAGYDWLVIAGANAKYKGVGTINGEGAYKFMLTATDGDLLDGGADVFRIKIWYEAGDGEVVVYDNRAELGDDEYGGTELGGGSIVIHKATK